MKVIDIRNSTYRTKYDKINGNFVLFIDGFPLKTPNEKIICHTNHKLLQHMQSELECRNILDVSELTLYSMYSTLNDILIGQNVIFSKEDIRLWIISDPILRACAGPEKAEQFYKWGALFQILEEIEISYPDIIQTADTEEVENWIISMGRDYEKDFKKFIDKMYEEFQLLSKEQQVVVLNALNCHGSFTYGLLLATRKCSELEYATAILAGYCQLPLIFGDVTRDEYKTSFNQLICDANILTNFIRFSLEPNTDTVGYIKTHINGYEFLPESAKWAVLEACRNLLFPKSDDYSCYVVLLGKSLEVTLKNLIFDDFQTKFKASFFDEKEIIVFIRENDVIEKLAKYLVRPPHFIELGSMLTVLQKYGGKTAKNNLILANFFNFIENEKKKADILSSSFINESMSIARLRNDAAHAKRFSLDEAKQVMNSTLNLLSRIV